MIMTNEEDAKNLIIEHTPPNDLVLTIFEEIKIISFEELN